MVEAAWGREAMGETHLGESCTVHALPDGTRVLGTVHAPTEFGNDSFPSPSSAGRRTHSFLVGVPWKYAFLPQVTEARHDTYHMHIYIYILDYYVHYSSAIITTLVMLMLKTQSAVISIVK